MVIVTGAAGFIGSHIARDASKENAVVLIDKHDAFTSHDYVGEIGQRFDASEFLERLDEIKDCSSVIHMGAITNTAEQDRSQLAKWNTDYTKTLWKYCTQNQIPFIYASSAATYGDGSRGFSDAHDRLSTLNPLNPYGVSKHNFDIWALSQTRTPPKWYGLKFFNVFGPHEDHKARMASSVWHGFREIAETGAMTLFRSHNPAFKDGDQARDFIFIEDVLRIIRFLQKKSPASGMYNCGTGKATTFMTLAQELFAAVNKPLRVNWVDTPDEFRAAYQYRTCAEMGKIASAGFKEPFTNLSSAIKQYVSYLVH